MIKKTIINDLVMYVKLKVSGLRRDYYFNRKGCDNKERGHFAIENGEIVCKRPAPALDIIPSGDSLLLEISGSRLIRI